MSQPPPPLAAQQAHAATPPRPRPPPPGVRPMPPHSAGAPRPRPPAPGYHPGVPPGHPNWRPPMRPPQSIGTPTARPLVPADASRVYQPMYQRPPAPAGYPPHARPQVSSPGTPIRPVGPPTMPSRSFPGRPIGTPTPGANSRPAGYSHPTSPVPLGTPRSPTSHSGSASGHGSRRRLYPEQITSAYTQPLMGATTAPPTTTMSGGTAAVPYSGSPTPQYFVPGAEDTPQVTTAPAPPGYAPSAAQGYPNASVNALQNQFSNMFMGTGPGSLPSSLLAGPPEIWALDQPTTPDVILPPHTSAVPSPVLCDPSHMRSTLVNVPHSASLLKKSKLVWGMTFTPFKTQGEGEAALPVVRDIVRCRRCRTYFNPFIQFTDGGHKWVCNLCGLKNDVPSFFDYDPHYQTPVDRFQRPDLNHAVVEYLAPAQYMNRPPQPPVYVFIIDVSHDAVRNGSVGVVAQSILDSLDSIPNTDGRVMVSILTVDSALHFYSMTSESTEPQMLVVADLDETFLPFPSQLLVNLAECRPAIESLLGRLGEMFQSSTSTFFALGPALQAARRLIQHVGGKIVVCQSCLANHGAGALKNREDPKVSGTFKESELLKPADGFYSAFIQQVLGLQITVDFFIFASQYVDLASTIPLAKISGGSVHMYPSFLSTRSSDVHKAQTEIRRFLAQENGWEAVLRIRASPGIRFPAYYGHHFLRSTDLLALPNVTPDHCYAADVTLESDLVGQVMYVQSALLYTSAHGERRIRVATLALPVVSQVRDLFRGVDQLTTAVLLAKKAVDRTVSSKLEDARKAVEYKTLDLVQVDRTELGLGNSTLAQIPVPRTLNLIPLLSLATLKHPALRATSGMHMPSDLRTFAISQVMTMAPEALLPYLLAQFYALHELPPEAGHPDLQSQLTVLPPRLNLSSEKLARHGVFLLFSTCEQFLWVGRDTHPGLLQDLFGVQSYPELTSGNLVLPELDTDMSRRTRAIMHRLEARMRFAFCPTLYLIKEDAPAQLRSLFHSHLVEDKTLSIMSYQQFLSQLREKLQK
ncbi:COPII subunit [Dispira simplex]|nr:COPII subunit [Dispira simplex]